MRWASRGAETVLVSFSSERRRSLGVEFLSASEGIFLAPRSHDAFGAPIPAS